MADTFKRPGLVIEGTFIFLTAVVWRLYLCFKLYTPDTDEIAFGLPTINEFLAGRFPVHPLGLSYQGTVDAAVSALLVTLTGSDALFILRIPSIIFPSLAVLIFWLILRRNLQRLEGLVVALLLALPNSSVISKYGLGTLLSALMIWLALKLKNAPSKTMWLIWGAFSGFCIYHFPLLQVQLLICLGWLFFSPDDWRRFKNGFLIMKEDAPPVRCAKGAVYAAVLLAVLTGYYYLTRRVGFHAGVFFILAVSASVLAFLSVLAFWLRMGWFRLERSQVLRLIYFLPGFLFFRMVPELIYKHQATHPAVRSLHSNTTYSLRHMHEWPGQMLMFLDRILPDLVLGYRNHMEGGSVTVTSISPNFWAGLALLFFLSWGFVRGMVSKKQLFDHSGLPWVCMASFILTCILMLPSWFLVQDYSIRYLMPYLAGFYLLLLYAISHSIGRKWFPAVGLAIVIWSCVEQICYENKFYAMLPDRGTPAISQTGLDKPKTGNYSLNGVPRT